MNTKPAKTFPEAIVDIESLSHDGRGITHINDKTTFIHGALPHEKVKCKLTKRHSRYNEGEVIEVIEAAAGRVTPPCEHFGICGGCSLQHLEHTQQLQFKENVLLEQLKHFGEVSPSNLLKPLAGNPLHYRRKARLGVRYVRKKGRLLVGFREKGSAYLADLKTCSVLHESVGLRLPQLSELIRSLSQYEHIAQIEVAISDTETALVFRHLTDLPIEDIQKLKSFAKDFNLHFYLQPNPPAKVHKIFPEDSVPRLHYQLKDFNLTLQFHPLDFTQINGEMNPRMIAEALQLLAPEATDKILDLFCGLGNFTLPLARFAKQVIGIEGSQEMVTRAQENAALNHIQNAEFFASNLFEPTPEASWMQNTYDKILLDPPRTGALEIIRCFERFSPKRIVYVSCNPATLARDAKELVHTQHYKLQAAGIINMFPHTSHIEAMALFEK